MTEANAPGDADGRAGSAPDGGPTTTGTDAAGPPPVRAPKVRDGAGRRLGPEVWIVLGLSLGQSAVYSVISLTAKLTAGPPLAQQTATLNASRSRRAYLDLAYQLADIAFTLVPVLLVLWLLGEGGRSALKTLGIDRSRPGRDLLYGAGLSALIGLPGLGLYFAGQALGVTATIVPAALDTHWWTVPVLILQAVKNAVLEEVVAVGYLVTRLERFAWSPVAVVASSALLRGSYHLYQGFGPFLGNAVMGVIFAEWYRRTRRVTPLIVAHTVLDVVSFVGYQLFGDALGLT